MDITRLTIAIYGLGCGGGGALTVERALAKLPGVVRVHINPATEMAYVEYDSARLRWEQVAAAIEAVGFRAGEPTVR